MRKLGAARVHPYKLPKHILTCPLNIEHCSSNNKPQENAHMLQLGEHQVEHLHLLDQGLGLHKTCLQLVLQSPELQLLMFSIQQRSIHLV